jgi:hypothetical protein
VLVVVDPREQYGLVVHGEARVDEALARGDGLGRELPGMIEVGHHPEGVVWTQSVDELRVDAHRQRDRDARR